MGYHITEIPKGILGELSKIEEEIAELSDALAQGNKLMAMQELSDMYGAIELMLKQRFLGITMEDLAIMSRATRRAFLDGTRPSFIPHITLEELNARYTGIHFFGLGFIQIKLGVSERVHVYHPELPAFVDEPHDHRYDFESFVLSGVLTNTLYAFAAADGAMTDHHMFETSCSPDNTASMVRTPVRLLERSEDQVKKGESYVMGRDQFHTVATSPYCITYLRRSPVVKEYARVVRREGAPAICPFSKNVPTDRLWEYVHDAWKLL